jgi:hypothetical protein
MQIRFFCGQFVVNNNGKVNRVGCMHVKGDDAIITVLSDFSLKIGIFRDYFVCITCFYLESK